MIFLKILSDFEHQLKPKLKFEIELACKYEDDYIFQSEKNIFIFQWTSNYPISNLTLILMQPPSRSIHIWKQLLLNQDSILLPLAPQLSPLPLYQPAVYKIFTIQFFLVLSSNCFLAYGILHGILKDIPIIQIWHPRDFIGKNPLNFIGKNPLDFISSFFL